MRCLWVSSFDYASCMGCELDSIQWQFEVACASHILSDSFLFLFLELNLRYH